MARRSTAPPRPPAGPPADADAGATFVRDYTVKLYDKQDGQGVDWFVCAGVAFKAAFDMLEKVPTDAQREKLAERVFTLAHERFLAGSTDPAPVRGPLDAAAAKPPSNTDDLKSSPPGPSA